METRGIACGVPSRLVTATSYPFGRLLRAHPSRVKGACLLTGLLFRSRLLGMEPLDRGVALGCQRETLVVSAAPSRPAARGHRPEWQTRVDSRSPPGRHDDYVRPFHSAGGDALDVPVADLRGLDRELEGQAGTRIHCRTAAFFSKDERQLPSEHLENRTLVC